MPEQKDKPRQRRVGVRYEGRVQGVGFRYTAVSVSSSFDVTGYVQNEPDGSVTLVAEGREDELVRFLRAIKESHLGRYITAERLKWSEATGEFAGFTVRHAWW
jgi:acylphosphatase